MQRCARGFVALGCRAVEQGIDLLVAAGRGVRERHAPDLRGVHHSAESTIRRTPISGSAPWQEEI